MPAFSSNTKYLIDQNIDTMFRRLKAVSFKSVTYEDFIQLFVPAEHRELFRRCAPITLNYGRSVEYKWVNGMRLRFQLNGSNHTPPVPRDMELQPDAPEELIRDITEWTNHGGDASGDCGRVKKVFEILNEKCSRSQLRFIFPSILSILTATDRSELKELAQSLQETKVPSRPLELPVGVTQACRKAAATVAICALIPHDILDKHRDHGEVAVFASEGAEYSEIGLGTFRGIF